MPRSAPRRTSRSRGVSRRPATTKRCRLPRCWTSCTRSLGIDPETAALDKGYDNNRVYADCSERGIAPVVPLGETPDVKKGKDKPLQCEHGEWRFAGADQKRNAAK
jgi:hypothetical protein